MIRNYIANQRNSEKDEIFKIEDEFQSYGTYYKGFYERCHTRN